MILVYNVQMTFQRIHQWYLYNKILLMHYKNNFHVQYLKEHI